MLETFGAAATTYEASAPFAEFPVIWRPSSHGERERIADRRAAEAAELAGGVDRLADELVIARRRRRDLRLTGEEHEADPHADGTLSRNVCIAFCAAASLVGFTSTACIEPETSSTRITVALSLVMLEATCGRATATHSAASAARNTLR